MFCIHLLCGQDKHVEPICHRDIQVELRIEFTILFFFSVTGTVVLHGLFTSAVVAYVFPKFIIYALESIQAILPRAVIYVPDWPLPFLSRHSSLRALKILVSGQPSRPLKWRQPGGAGTLTPSDPQAYTFQPNKASSVCVLEKTKQES